MTVGEVILVMGTFFDAVHVRQQSHYVMGVFSVSVDNRNLSVGKTISSVKAAEESGALCNFTIDINQWLREVCSTRLLLQCIQLGGSQKIVHIDELLFKHKPKVLIIKYEHRTFVHKLLLLVNMSFSSRHGVTVIIIVIVTLLIGIQSV